MKLAQLFLRITLWLSLMAPAIFSFGQSIRPTRNGFGFTFTQSGWVINSEPGREGDARLHAFWEFGDGQYKFSNTPYVAPPTPPTPPPPLIVTSDITYSSRIVTNPNEGLVVLATGHGIYSTSNQPPRASATRQTYTQGASYDLKYLAIDTFSSKSVMYDLSWGGRTKPEQQFVVVLIYRRPPQSVQSSTSGFVELLYNDRYINPVNLGPSFFRSRRGEIIETTLEPIPFPSFYNKRIRWRYSDLAINEQRAIFIDMKVNPATRLPASTNNSYQIQITNSNGGTQYTETFARPIGVSLDPSYVLIKPGSVLRTEPSQKLDFNVHFENSGDIGVDIVTVRVPLHNAFDSTSITDIYYQRSDGSYRTQISKNGDPTRYRISNDTLIFEIHKARLASGQFSKTIASGDISFQLWTRPEFYGTLDTITTKAFIMFKDAQSEEAAAPFKLLILDENGQPCPPPPPFPDWFPYAFLLVLLIIGILIALLIILARRNSSTT